MAVATPGQVPSVPTEPPGAVSEPGAARAVAVVVAANRKAGQQRRAALVDRFAALIPVAALIAIIVVLAVKALPAIKYNGVGFLSRSTWRPGNTYANAVTTNGVLHRRRQLRCLAAHCRYGRKFGHRRGRGRPPFGLCGFGRRRKTSPAPVQRFRRISRSPGRHPQRGVRSLGFGTFGPIIARDVAPFFAHHLPDVPVLDFFRGDTGSGEGLLTASLVLSIMIVPIVAATSRRLLPQVPALPKEGAMALGMNDWEVVRKVSLPWVRAGIIGASVLGLARALGETIAVAMVSAPSLGTVPTNLYLPFGTIAATIVSQLDGALSDGTGFAVETLGRIRPCAGRN